MEMSYNGALVMPSNYVVVDANEMEYLDGGLTLSYKWSYSTKIGATNKAIALKNSKKWNNISTYDLAAEIYTHAFAYYNFGLFLVAARSLGFGTSVANSILGGIDVENKLDTKNLAGGVKRYQFYRAFFAL
ncbi:MAG: hypothetical protein UHK60_04705 [Acutalibacteraceae bacterium]|nr:hypothetical protein [Acutalibacteraceae bacterium]